MKKGYKCITIVLLAFVLLFITINSAMAAPQVDEIKLTPKEVQQDSTKTFILKFHNNGSCNITEVWINVNSNFKNVKWNTCPPDWGANFLDPNNKNEITWITFRNPMKPCETFSFSYEAKAPSKVGDYKHEWGVKADNGPWQSNGETKVVTKVIPEFTTIAIPVVAILGLVFLFSRRKRKD